MTSLYRYAVKGLSGDSLSSVKLATHGETFPDDRRYALLYEKNQDKFNGKDWLHKENFLCAFTEPALMASLESKYNIKTNEEGTIERLLQIHDRYTNELLLPPTDLSTFQGRDSLGKLLSRLSGKKVVCVTADADESPQTFQFGNTSSGYKKNKGDTRTVHIVNRQTVNALSNAIGIPLDPRRFRPNIVIDGPSPFAEFEWVENGQFLGTSSGSGRLRALSRTVRCRGISLDPFDEQHGSTELDIPALLVEHFPQHGPFLGIYASLEQAPFSLAVGDELMLVDGVFTEE